MVGDEAGSTAVEPEAPPQSTARGSELRALSGTLAALAAWAAWFIWRTSFVVDGRRVFCLFDDAMISMTYARNLVSGFGLNWARQGAPVEGFTHPLWTALMVPVNLLPIALDRRSLVIQLVSLALLMLNVELVRRLMVRHFARPGASHWLPACVLTAFYYPLDYWALMGMETGLQAVLTTASVLLALDIVHARRDRHLALLVVGTLAVLLRLDMLPLVIAVQVYVLGNGGLRRGDAGERRSWARHWLAGVAVLVGAVAGYGAFRWIYFRDLLPNTYYLKLAGVPLAVRLLRGGSALLDTLLAHWPLLLAVGIGVWQLPAGLLAPIGGSAAAEPGQRRWASRLLLPLGIFALCCAYSVYVGGDAWEGEEIRANRFVAFAMPLVFVVFNALLNQALTAPAARATLRGLPPPAVRLGLAAVTMAALLGANGLLLAPEKLVESRWRAWLVLSRPHLVAAHREVLGQLRALQRIADRSAVVAVVWAGIPSYFSDWRLIDQLGYNDRHIARAAPVRVLDEDTFENFHPGHVKGDVMYVLDVLRPDAIFQPWGVWKAIPRLPDRGFLHIDTFYVNPASPRIHLTAADRQRAAGTAATTDELSAPAP